MYYKPNSVRLAKPFHMSVTVTIKTHEDPQDCSSDRMTCPYFLRNDSVPKQRGHIYLLGLLKERIMYIPAVKPVLTNVTFDHKPANIVGLPADTV